jgi:hypothetical protein
MPLSTWNTSALSTSASLMLSYLMGITMNSWKASLLPAWLPPLMMFSEGMGIMNLFLVPVLF